MKKSKYGQDEDGMKVVRVKVGIANDSRYVPAMEVLSKKETRQYALHRAIEELDDFRRKYDNLVELRKTVKYLGQVVTAYRRKRMKALAIPRPSIRRV